MHTHELDRYEGRREKKGEVVIAIISRQHRLFIFPIAHTIQKLNPSIDANRLSKMMASAFLLLVFKRSAFVKYRGRESMCVGEKRMINFMYWSR